MDIAAFVGARLDEDEAAAKAAGGGEWHAAGHPGDHVIVADSAGDPVVWNEGSPTEDEAAHIARWDPARALREVAAKRAILALHECAAAELRASPGDARVAGWARATEVAARDVATVWSDHPGYDRGWAPAG